MIPRRFLPHVKIHGRPGTDVMDSVFSRCVSVKIFGCHGGLSNFGLFLLSILSSILPQPLERFGETMENMATAFYSTTTGSANCTIVSDTPNHIQGHASCFQSTNGLPFAPVGLGFGLG
jgi:hypothetical protein